MATEQTVGDLDTLLTSAFDGTEFVEVFPTSGGVSKKVAVTEVINYPSDTAWTSTTTLLNDWTGTIRYIKRAGMVTVICDNLDGTGASDGTVLTLPLAYRPAVTVRQVGRNGASTNRATIGTTGGIAFASLGAPVEALFTYPVIT